jgi:hypothetical protein
MPSYLSFVVTMLMRSCPSGLKKLSTGYFVPDVMLLILGFNESTETAFLRQCFLGSTST